MIPKIEEEVGIVFLFQLSRDHLKFYFKNLLMVNWALELFWQADAVWALLAKIEPVDWRDCMFKYISKVNKHEETDKEMQ